jgi:hypothetical protein
VNLDKSSVFFGPRCDDQGKNDVKMRLEVHSEVLNDFYLGMPTSVGSSPTAAFKFLYDRMWKCINGLSDRPLSRAGYEALLKSIIQAILAFVISCFLLPLTNCDRMKSITDGGLRKTERKIYTGDHGLGYHLQKRWEAWAFGTLRSSIRLCSLNKDDDC